MNDAPLNRLIGKPLEIDNVNIGLVTNVSLEQDSYGLSIHVSARMDEDAIDRLREYIFLLDIFEQGVKNEKEEE